jgi:hypothetical protein
MKTLMQLYAEEDKGVVFFESAINLKHQRHTCIEAVPIPFDLFDEIPAYFSVSRALRARRGGVRLAVFLDAELLEVSPR